ncbi:MAG: hypothetical protein EB084_22610, partial [Proteobacteria bacterium]|nr:hypothetical protein [Pseudomonadota bacterium]
MTTHAWQHANAPLRGSAILLALFFLTALFLLAQAFQRLLPVELNAALIHQTDTSAYFAADAGVQDAIAYIENQLANGREVASPLTRPWAGLGAFSYQTTITADAQTPPNGSSPLRVFTLVSDACRSSDSSRRPVRRITASIAQQSFARFGYFADKTNGIPYGISYEFDGPFHVNDPLQLTLPSEFYNGGYAAIFNSTATSASVVSGSADGVDYKGTPPFDGWGNPIAGRYEKVYKQGRHALTTGARRVELPPNTASLANAAWGDPTMPKPTTAGVYVNQAKTGNDA